MAETAIPRARLKIGLQPCDPSSDRFLIQQCKPRNARSHSRINIGFWSAPEGREEAIDTIMGDRHRVNAAVPEFMLQLGNRRTPFSIEVDNFGKVPLSEPEIGEGIGVKGKDAHSCRDPFHFSEAQPPVGPMMQCKHCERRVERTSSKR